MAVDTESHMRVIHLSPEVAEILAGSVIWFCDESTLWSVQFNSMVRIQTVNKTEKTDLILFTRSLLYNESGKAIFYWWIYDKLKIINSLLNSKNDYYQIADKII